MKEFKCIFIGSDGKEISTHIYECECWRKALIYAECIIGLFDGVEFVFIRLNEKEESQ